MGKEHRFLEAGNNNDSQRHAVRPLSQKVQTLEVSEGLGQSRTDNGAAVPGSGSAAAGTVHDELIGVVCGDSSAALAISNRKGCGKLRHIHIGELWLQEKVGQGEVVMRKVLGDDNPADFFTKHLVQAKIVKYCGIMHLLLTGGRASAGLHVQHGGSLHRGGQAV